MQTQGIAPQTGRESQVKALGKWWTIGRFTVEIWDELLEWAKPRIISPLDHLERIIAKVPEQAAYRLVSEAMKEYPRILTILHPLFQEILDTPEGKLRRFYLLLRQHHPDVTPDLAKHILEEIGPVVEDEALAKAHGQPGEGKKNEDTYGVGSPGAAFDRADQLARRDVVPHEGMQTLAYTDQEADVARGPHLSGRVPAGG
jgi:hypothetical protein